MSPSSLLLSGDRYLNLSLESLLRELFLDDFWVEMSSLGRAVALKFEQNLGPPGVILKRDGKFVGMISRRRFWQQMSRPYSLELFSQRPIENLYSFVRSEILILDGKTRILEAAKQSLHRSPELLYEPIVVRLDENEYRLLDTHQLLVAQAHIHELATQILRQFSQQLEAANRELERLATLDGLTEIGNRRRFDEYLKREWQQLGRSRLPLSLMLCDVDYFKSYNDTYGHLAGDDCLRQVAKTLEKTVQDSGALVARYGGEEFAIILPNTDQMQARELAETIRIAIAQLQILHQGSIVNPYITLSIGIATQIPPLGAPPQNLIMTADEALYQAKQTGRDRVFILP